jgi:hypothetical protein
VDEAVEKDHDVVRRNIIAAAAQSGRTFAIEYDISGSKCYRGDEVKVTARWRRSSTRSTCQAGQFLWRQAPQFFKIAPHRNQARIGHTG